jgi:hypothetical protein
MAPGKTISGVEKECKRKGFNNGPEKPETCETHIIVYLEKYKL